MPSPPTLEPNLSLSFATNPHNRLVESSSTAYLIKFTYTIAERRAVVLNEKSDELGSMFAIIYLKHEDVFSNKSIFLAKESFCYGVSIGNF